MKLEICPELYQKVEKAYRWFLNAGLISSSEFTLEEFALGMLQMSIENYSEVTKYSREQNVERL